MRIFNKIMRSFIFVKSKPEEKGLIIYCVKALKLLRSRLENSLRKKSIARTRKMTKKVSVRKSGIAGRGVFAGEDIKKGELIFRAGDNFNVFVFLNHSCRPSAELIKQNERASCDKLFARRNIKTEEEINFDYRKTRWSHYYDEIEEKTGCSCGKCK